MAEQKTPTEIRWKASEYVEHHRTINWYFALAIVTAVLAGATYLLTRDRFG